MNTIPNVTYVFDAEWIPCARTGRRLHPDIDANATDQVVFERLWQAAGANTANPRPFLKFALSQVVGISAVRRAILPDGRIALELLSYPGSRNTALTEQEIITNFLEKVGADHGQLVGYNSAAADLPVLIQRATATGCHCPKFGARPASRSKDFDYFDRGSEAHLDLVQHLAHGAHHPSAAIPSLHQFAAACGIPGKLGHDGSSVVDLWLAGRHRDIIGYNLCDACTTYLLWLRCVVFHGLLTEDAATAELTQFRALLKAHATTNPHLQRFLAAWPTPTATRPPAANPNSWLVQITVQLDDGRTAGADRLRPPNLRTLNIDLNQLESSQRNALCDRLAGRGRSFRFSHVKRAANDKLVFPERDGRTILIPVASPDLDGLLAALRSHSIESVDDWHPLDAR